MAVHFHKLKIKTIEIETIDCVSVCFEIPTYLEKTFEYVHGQNVTVKQIINGIEVRRSYSICTAPYEKQLKIAIKKVAGGQFSQYANDILKAGDELEILPPTGKFNTKLLYNNCKKYVAFAAGSGVTPILSIIKSTLYAEPNSTFTLVYGNKNRSSIIFFEALEAIKNKYLSRFNFINILSREKTEAPINFGRIDNEKLKSLSTLINYNSIDDFFICGPEEMIFCVKNFLAEKGIDTKKVHFELFGTVKKSLPIGKHPLAKEKPSAAKSNITVKLDGRSFDFALGFNERNILDAALAQGADLPFACKGGVCCTCKAKLLEGKVVMDVNWGLEDEEIEQGFILTCQSHPITNKVVVDFDIK